MPRSFLIANKRYRKKLGAEDDVKIGTDAAEKTQKGASTDEKGTDRLKLKLCVFKYVF